MGGIGGWEILLIFLVILLVFGAKRIPEIARGLGKGIREFKDATSNIKNELSLDDDNHRIQQPRYGATAPRQESYQQTAPTPPPQHAQAPPQQQSQTPPQQQAAQAPPPPQNAPAPPPPATQEAGSGERQRTSGSD